MLLATKDPSGRLVETAERIGLQAIGQHSCQQPALKLSRWLAAQMGAPLAAQPIEIMTLKARHNREC
jgi:hypothetical protein